MIRRRSSATPAPIRLRHGKGVGKGSNNGYVAGDGDHRQESTTDVHANRRSSGTPTAASESRLHNPYLGTKVFGHGQEWNHWRATGAPTEGQSVFNAVTALAQSRAAAATGDMSQVWAALSRSCRARARRSLQQRDADRHNDQCRRARADRRRARQAGGRSGL